MRCAGGDRNPAIIEAELVRDELQVGFGEGGVDGGVFSIQASGSSVQLLTSVWLSNYCR
jgi:hypothetical protein